MAPQKTKIAALAVARERIDGAATAPRIAQVVVEARQKTSSRRAKKQPEEEPKENKLTGMLKELKELEQAIHDQEVEIAKYEKDLQKVIDTPAADLGATDEGKDMLLHMRCWFDLVLQRRREHLVQKHHYLTISAMTGDQESGSPRRNARQIAVRAVWDRWRLWVECRVARRTDPAAGNRLRALNAIYETTATELGAHSFKHRPTQHSFVRPAPKFDDNASQLTVGSMRSSFTYASGATLGRNQIFKPTSM
jgi:hypothetical protein